MADQFDADAAVSSFLAGTSAPPPEVALRNSLSFAVELQKIAVATGVPLTGAKALNEGKTSNPAALVLGYQEPR